MIADKFKHKLPQLVQKLPVHSSQIAEEAFAAREHRKAKEERVLAAQRAK